MRRPRVSLNIYALITPTAHDRRLCALGARHEDYHALRPMTRVYTGADIYCSQTMATSLTEADIFLDTAFCTPDM